MPLRCAARVLFTPLLLLSLSARLSARPTPVEHTLGAAHGFLVIRSSSGNLIGSGEVLQFAQGNDVTSHVILRFRDGSLDDETTRFSQRGVFHLISDHHIQRGPFFSKPIDILVEDDGNVSTRSIGPDGKPTVEVTHIGLPPDVSNGLVPTFLADTHPDSLEFKVGMVAPMGKGRLIALAIAPSGVASFTCVGGIRRKASIFRIKPEFGGLTGVVAPIIGKQPDDTYIWVLEGEVPAVVRITGQLSEGGPLVSVEMAGTHFPPFSRKDR